MGNTGLLRREAEMTLLQPQDAKNSGIYPFGIPPCSSLNL